MLRIGASRAWGAAGQAGGSFKIQACMLQSLQDAREAGHARVDTLRKAVGHAR